ncbi:MAG: glycine zipper 2TM domain-containing protein [Hyphomonadaceae bacterium]|nr:glycine zipper 2TM domain-containing protein [Hyphomonadaceae bacterium]
MRLKAILLVTALGVTAMPAAAQSYRDNCGGERRENQAGGAILGAVLGGILGSNVAASGHRHDGTAVGAVLGGLAGSEIGRSSTNCDPRYHEPSGSYGGRDYPPYGPDSRSYDPRYPSYPSGYEPRPAIYPPSDYGDYREREYRYGSAASERRSYEHHQNRSNDLYRDDDGSYNQNQDYAGRDCSDAIQTTRLPDGTEISRSVEACRDTYYGGWKVRD